VTDHKAGLPLRTRLFYGTSRIGSEAVGRSQGLWLVYYYAPPEDAHLPTLLPSLAVGVLLTAAGILSALDDAIVGYLSDKTRSPWGRRTSSSVRRCGRSSSSCSSRRRLTRATP